MSIASRDRTNPDACFVPQHNRVHTMRPLAALALLAVVAVVLPCKLPAALVMSIGVMMTPSLRRSWVIVLRTRARVRAFVAADRCATSTGMIVCACHPAWRRFFHVLCALIDS